MTRPRREYRYNAQEAVRMIMEMEDSSDVEDVEGSESEDDGEIDHLETDVEDSTSEIDNSLATANNLQETSSSDNDENENVRFNEPQDGTSIGENIYILPSLVKDGVHNHLQIPVPEKQIYLARNQGRK